MRLAQLRVSPEMLIEACKEGFAQRSLRILRNALPPDAKFHHAYHDPRYVTVVLVIESSEFSDVPEGGAIPFLPEPVLTTA